MPSVGMSLSDHPSDFHRRLFGELAQLKSQPLLGVQIVRPQLQIPTEIPHRPDFVALFQSLVRLHQEHARVAPHLERV